MGILPMNIMVIIVANSKAEVEKSAIKINPQIITVNRIIRLNAL